MTRKPVVLHRADWARDPRLWRGRFEGKDVGTGVTVLFYATEEVGKGAVWHVHPYDEVFIVRTGRARYKIGDEPIDKDAGHFDVRGAFGEFELDVL